MEWNGSLMEETASVCENKTQDSFLLVAGAGYNLLLDSVPGIEVPVKLQAMYNEMI